MSNEAVIEGKGEAEKVIEENFILSPPAMITELAEN